MEQAISWHSTKNDRPPLGDSHGKSPVKQLEKTRPTTTMDERHVARKQEDAVRVKVGRRMRVQAGIIADDVDDGIERVRSLLLGQVFVEDRVSFVVDNLKSV